MGLSTASLIPMISTSMIPMVSTVKSCPVWALIPQLTGRYLYLQSSTSQVPAEIPSSLSLDLLFLGSTIRTLPPEMSFHPVLMIQKLLWIEHLKLTQFILNRMVKSKQSCNDTFLIFKEQISGTSEQTVIMPTRTNSLEKYCRKYFEFKLKKNLNSPRKMRRLEEKGS